MDNRPFMFGIPVEDSHFIGRHTETERLSANFRNGINTILLSPRRWGKTSLVNKVATMVNSKEIVVVTMDIFSCRNEYDFYNMFSEAILKQTASRMEEWKDLAKGFIERLVPKISMSLDGQSEYGFSLGITPKTHQRKCYPCPKSSQAAKAAKSLSASTSSNKWENFLIP